MLEAILKSPELYAAPMVKPPVVQLAGMLRARGKAITDDRWTWLCDNAGQRLYQPPDVAGWRDDAWLDTSTVRGRWYLVNYVLDGETVPNSHPAETPEQAVARALEFWGGPQLADDTVAARERWSANAAVVLPWDDKYAQRQNALRQLIGVSPDYLTC